MRSSLWLIVAVSAGITVGLASTVARNGVTFGSRPAFAQDDNNGANQPDQEQQQPAEGAEQQEPDQHEQDQQQVQGGTEQNDDQSQNQQQEQSQDGSDNQSTESQGQN
jgi:hypothetical protein